MRCLRRLIWMAILVSVPACRDGDRLGRVEVRGTVAYQGAPVERGLITFRPAKGAKGPAAGGGIVAGKFLIPAEQGPIAGPAEVEVRIATVDGDAANSGEPAAFQRGSAQMKSFSQRVEVSKGVNEFEFSFPNSQPIAGKNAIP